MNNTENSTAAVNPAPGAQEDAPPLKKGADVVRVTDRVTDGENSGRRPSMGDKYLASPLHRFLDVGQFPLAELGEPLASACSEVAEHFHLPIDEVALVMLTVQGGIYGPGTHLRTLWDDRLPGALLTVIGAAVTTNFQPALERICRTMRKWQRTQLNNHCKANVRETERKLVDTRNPWKNPPSQRTDKQEIDLFRTAGQLTPEFLLESLDGKGILAALPNSQDGGLLHVSAHANALPDLSGRNVRSRENLDLFRRLLSGAPIRVLGRSRVAAHIDYPSLHGFLVITTEELRNLFGNLQSLEGVLVFSSDAAPTPVDLARKKWPFLDEWMRAVSDKHFKRTAYSSETLTASIEALGLLSGFRNQVLDLVPQTAPELHPWLMNLYSLAGRFYANLSVFDDVPDMGIPADKAHTAVKLCRWFASKQLKTWDTLQQEATGAALEIMFVRIKVKGPITRRDLLRTFDRQSRALHDPVIKQLLESGRIKEDEQGRLLAPAV